MLFDSILNGFMEELNMKNFFITIALAAVAVIACPKTAKAASALDNAVNFNNMQQNYLTAQNLYYNSYELPVMNVYDAAMSAQISQALAAQYQSQLMRQQPMQMDAVNRYQIVNNFDADMRNFGTQMYNISNTLSYNAGMQFVNYNQAALQNGANTVALLTGTYQPFPQVP